MQVFEDYNTKKCVIIIILSWVLIGLVVAFWNDSTKYMLFALFIPIWMLIQMRLEENKTRGKIKCDNAQSVVTYLILNQA